MLNSVCLEGKGEESKIELSSSLRGERGQGSPCGTTKSQSYSSKRSDSALGLWGDKRGAALDGDVAGDKDVTIYFGSNVVRAEIDCGGGLYTRKKIENRHILKLRGYVCCGLENEVCGV